MLENYTQQLIIINTTPLYHIVIQKDLDSYIAIIQCGDKEWHNIFPLLYVTEHFSYYSDEKKIIIKFEKANQIVSLLSRYYQASDTIHQTEDARQDWDCLTKELDEEMKLYSIQYGDVAGFGMNEITYALKFFMQKNPAFTVINPGYNAKEQLLKIRYQFNLPQNQGKIALIPYALNEHNVLVVVNPHTEIISLFDPQQVLTLSAIKNLIESLPQFANFEAELLVSNYLPQKDEWACGIFVIQAAIDLAEEVKISPPIALQPELHLRRFYRAASAWADIVHQDYLVNETRLLTLQRNNIASALRMRLDGPFGRIAKLIFAEEDTDFSKYAITYFNYVDFSNPEFDSVFDERCDLLNNIVSVPLQKLLDFKSQVLVEIEDNQAISAWVDENYHNILMYYFTDEEVVPTQALILRFVRTVVAIRSEETEYREKNNLVLECLTSNQNPNTVANSLANQNQKIQAEIRQQFPGATDEIINLWHKQYEWFVLLRRLVSSNKIQPKNFIQHDAKSLAYILDFIDFYQNAELSENSEESITVNSKNLLKTFFSTSAADSYFFQVVSSDLVDFNINAKTSLLEFAYQYLSLTDSQLGMILDYFVRKRFYQAAISVCAHMKALKIQSITWFEFLLRKEYSAEYVELYDKLYYLADGYNVRSLMGSFSNSEESMNIFPLVINFAKDKIKSASPDSRNPFASTWLDTWILESILKAVRPETYPALQELLLMSNPSLQITQIDNMIFRASFLPNNAKHSEQMREFLITRIDLLKCLDLTFDHLCQLSNSPIESMLVGMSSKFSAKDTEAKLLSYFTSLALNNDMHNIYKAASNEPVDIFSFNIPILIDRFNKVVSSSGLKLENVKDLVRYVISVIKEQAKQFYSGELYKLNQFFLTLKNGSYIEQLFALFYFGNPQDLNMGLGLFLPKRSIDNVEGQLENDLAKKVKLG